jgi:hypothetical protein
MTTRAFSFRKTVAVGLVALTAAPSAAQPLTKEQCRLANAVAGELFKKYNGRLSAQFVTSIKSFVAKDCDMDTDFKIVDGTKDKDAFAELRVRLIAN